MKPLQVTQSTHPTWLLLQAEKLLHLLRLLGIRSTIKPLTKVGISATSPLYFYPGTLMCHGPHGIYEVK